MGHWGWLRLASTQPKGSKYHIGLRNGGGLIWPYHGLIWDGQMLIFHDISILSKTIQAQSQSVQISAIESVKHSKDVYICTYIYIDIYIYTYIHIIYIHSLHTWLQIYIVGASICSPQILFQGWEGGNSCTLIPSTKPVPSGLVDLWPTSCWKVHN